MSLRVRLALGVALLVVLGIGLSGWFAVTSARSELEAEVDQFLLDRAERIKPLLNESPLRNDRRQRQATDFVLDLVNPDALTQVVNDQGDIIFASDPPLPVSDFDKDRSGRSGNDYALLTASVEGEKYRIISTSAGSRLTLMVGRDLGEVDRAVSGIARRTLLVGLVGAALAALAAWLVSGRFTQPLQRLTVAAENVAETQELAQAIHVDRSDEVGRLATSFNTMLAALETSRQQQHRLVMDASHELRTPLTSLRTNIDFMHSAPSLSGPERQEILTDVKGELTELSTLVSELVEMATITGAPDEPFESIDLNEAVQQSVDVAARRHGRVINVTGQGAQLSARPSQLKRAVNNLLHNAAKFSPEGSPIEVNLAGGRISVRDYGPGIAPEDKELVFNRFYRATATRDEPGSGLGLAIVHQVVLSHQGRVFVDEPGDGAGAIVGFELPLHDQSQ